MSTSQRYTEAMRSIMRMSLVLSSSSIVFALAGCPSPSQQVQQLAYDNACSVDDDCCVVVDDCSSEAFIVEAAEFDDAVDIIATASTFSCAGCTVPTVVTECVDGQCVGRAFDPLDVQLAGGQALSSCGAREVVSSGSQNIGYVEVVDGYAACGDIYY